MGVSIHPRPSRSKKEKDSDQKPASQPATPRHATPRHATAPPVRKNKHTSPTNAREQINKIHLTRVFDEKESPACLACAAEAFLCSEAAVSLFSRSGRTTVVLVAFPPIAHDRYTCFFFFEREQDLVLLSGAAAVSVILYFFLVPGTRQGQARHDGTRKKELSTIKLHARFNPGLGSPDGGCLIIHTVCVDLFFFSLSEDCRGHTSNNKS
jgi:hypothetical protein